KNIDAFSNDLEIFEPKQQLNKLAEYCKNHDIVLLRTIGVVFSDQEKKISEYIG
ncbi:uncharacterized protein METZ01_LOCUS444693, partial [marine metagenome]